MNPDGNVSSPARRRDVDHEGLAQLDGFRPGDNVWPSPSKPPSDSELLNPVEAAMYLRLHELGSHTPRSAMRTLNYWRAKGELKATKFARHVWYRKSELDRFLATKTEP